MGIMNKMPIILPVGELISSKLTIAINQGFLFFFCNNKILGEIFI